MSLSRITSSQSHQSGVSKKISLTQTTTRDALTGHLGHLSESQQNALKKFKTVCQEQKLYTPEQDGQPASHDDSTLLRFLRARRFDPVGALGQFKDTEEWRKSTDIDALYEHFDIKSYEDARKVYPCWTGRRDRRGIPLYVYVIKHLNSKNMEKYAHESSSKATAATHKGSKISPKMLRLFALYENMLQFVLPLCSFLDRPNPESQIVSTTNIVDISGVGLKQFWNLKGHMQDASTLATAHYPETLDRIFIIGAPAFFPTVWGWIKKWFDPVTTSKIFILSAHEVNKTLSSFIDPENIPIRYGGKLDWDFGHLPHIDRDAAHVLGERYTEEKNWIPGPIKWIHGSCYAMGSENGKDRKELVAVRPKHGLEAFDDSEKVPEEEAGIDSIVEDSRPTTANVINEDSIKKDDGVEHPVPETAVIANNNVPKQEETVQAESHPVTEAEIAKEEASLQPFVTAHEGTTPGELAESRELDPVSGQAERLAAEETETPQTQTTESQGNHTPAPSNEISTPHTEPIEEIRAETHPETGMPIHPNGMIHKALHLGNGLKHPHLHHHKDKGQEVNGSA